MDVHRLDLQYRNFVSSSSFGHLEILLLLQKKAGDSKKKLLQSTLIEPT